MTPSEKIEYLTDALVSEATNRFQTKFQEQIPNPEAFEDKIRKLVTEVVSEVEIMRMKNFS